MSRLLVLLASRRLLPMLLTQVTSGFNDNLFKSAFVMLVTFGAGRATALSPAVVAALAGGLLILPFLAFSATAGQIADRSERARLLRRLKLVEIGIVLGSTAALVTGSLALSLAMLFLLGTQSTFSGPVKYALLAQHLGESELVDGNALMEAGTFLGILAGTVAGGIATSLAAGPQLAAALLILSAGAGWLASRFVPPAPAPSPSLVIDRNPVRATGRVLHAARQSPEVWRAILAGGWFWLTGSVFLAQFPSWARDRLGADGSVVTLFFTCFTLGIALGSSLCGRLLQGRVSARLAPWAALAMAGFSLELGLGGPAAPAAGSPLLDVAGFLASAAGWRILASLLGVAIAGGIFIVPLYAIMQERSDPQIRARIMAANNIVSALFMSGAALIAAALSALGAAAPLLFTLLAVGNLATALLLRRGRSGPAGRRSRRFSRRSESPP